jgi:hypothetical protein
MVRRRQLRLNEQGRVIDAVTGEEIPAITISQVTFEENIPTASQENQDSVCLVTIQDDGHETCEYVDAGLERRKRGDVEQDRQVRHSNEDGKLAKVFELQ